MKSSLCHVALFLALGFASSPGCTATETGNPTFRYELDPFALDGEVVADDPMPPSSPIVVVTGAPGAVSPPEGQVLAWVLEHNLPPSSAEVQSDGSFGLMVTANPGGLLRIQARALGDAMSAPVDVRVSATEGLIRVMPATACVEFDPPLLDVLGTAIGSEAVIGLTNTCSSAVTRSPARLRSAHTGLELIDEGALELGPGESSRIHVRVLDESRPDDILVVPLLTPVPELRAVTLVSEAL